MKLAGSTPRVAVMRRALLAWYRACARDLPWRRTSDPYRIWLSEIMLQQTRVETVRDYFARFLAALPDVRSLAAAPLDRVLKLWEGLGYYSRARNLHRAAQEIVVEHGGAFPQAAEQLQTLPGVGRYTAAAIASIAFGQPAAALDGNIKRVLARLYCVTEPIDQPATTRRLWSLAEAVLDQDAPGDFNQAMMELGATVCTPRAPQCTICPVRAHCAALNDVRVEQIPARSVTRSVPRMIALAAAICTRGRLLAVQRPPHGLLGGLWELPGGALSTGGSAGSTLAAIVRETQGLRISVGRRLGTVTHLFTHRHLTLHVYDCRSLGGRLRPKHHSASRWVRPDEWEDLPLATLDRKVLALLEATQPGARRRESASSFDGPAVRRKNLRQGAAVSKSRVKGLLN